MLKILTDLFELTFTGNYVEIVPVINGVKQEKEQCVANSTRYGYNFESLPYQPTVKYGFKNSDLFTKLDMKENLISLHNVAVGSTARIMFETMGCYNSIIRQVNCGEVKQIDLITPFKLSDYTRRIDDGNLIVEPDIEIRKLDDGNYCLYEGGKDKGKIDMIENIYHSGFVVTVNKYYRIQVERPNFKW